MKFVARSDFFARALAVLVLALPTYLVRFEIPVVHVPMTLFECGVLAVCGAWIWVVVRERKRAHAVVRLLAARELRWFLVGAALLIVGATIGVVVAPDTRAALGLWKAYIVEPAFVAAIVLCEMRTRARLQLLVHALVVLGAVLALTGIVQALGHVGLVSPWNGVIEPIRATGVFPYPNALALILAPIAALSFFVPVWNPRMRAAYAVASVLMVLALLLTKSEGALGGVLAASLVIVARHPRRTWVFGALAAALVAMFAIPSIHRAALAVIHLKDVSTDVRLVLWQGTLRLIAAHPWVGAGLGGFPQLYAQYKEARHVELLLYPHSLLLNFWVETGALGVLGVVVLLGAVVRAALRKFGKDWLASAFAAGFLALVIHGLVDVPFFKNDLAVEWWIFVGAIMLFATVSPQELEAT